MDVDVLGCGLILRGIVPVWRGGRFDVLALCLGIVCGMTVPMAFVAEFMCGSRSAGFVCFVGGRRNNNGGFTSVFQKLSREQGDGFT